MYPGTHAQTTPDKPAVIIAGSGRTLTYRELDESSARLAKALHDLGTRRRASRSTGRRCAPVSTSRR